LSFDEGWYSADISTYAAAPGHSSAAMQIDGKKAVIVWELEPQGHCSRSWYWVGVYVRDTQPSQRLSSFMLRSVPNSSGQVPTFYLEPAPPSLYPLTNLLMEGCAQTKSDIEVVKRVFQTIKFAP
jgi:hypothetical protein